MGQWVSEGQLFAMALGLGDPWTVDRVEFDAAGGRLDIHIGFTRGARLACPECGVSCPVHDTVEREWRHMDFFQHRAYLHARVPRVRCDTHKVRQAHVPWARPGSGFTLLFEALALQLCRHMPVLAAARMVREHDTRIWRVLGHYVGERRAELDFSGVRQLAVDETSARRGQNYISVFMDVGRTRPRVLFCCAGREGAAIGAFVIDARQHGLNIDLIEHVVCDMSPAYITGVRSNLPLSRLVFDRFHVMKLFNEKIAIRRAEVKARPELKGTRYVWARNEETLSARQREQRAWLSRPSMQLKTARAVRWRDDLNHYWSVEPEDAAAYLDTWCRRAKLSRLEPIKSFVETIQRNRQGILRWHDSYISNGILEATNGLIQAAKRAARGYSNTDNLITITYLRCSDLRLPHPFHPKTHTI